MRIARLRRFGTAVFPAVLLTYALVFPAAADDAPGDLLARHITWLGGEQALRGRSALALEGRVYVAGLEGPLSVLIRADGYQRTEYDLKIIHGLEVVTPEDAWELNASGQVEPMGADKASLGRRGIRESFGLHLLGEEDCEISFPGPEERDGKTWEVIRFSYPGGDYHDLFLDPEDASCTWTRNLQDTETSWVKLSDWRMVEGVRYPFSQESTFDIPMKNQMVVWSAIAPAEAELERFTRPEAAGSPVRIHDPGGSTPWMPMTLFLDRYIYLPATVNGGETEFVLDSGAGMTVLDAATAARLNLKGEGALPAVGTGGAVEASVVNDITIRSGSLELTGLTAAVIDLSGINRRLGRDLSVILGKEVFNSVIVDIDYPNRRIAFRDPEKWSYEGDGAVLDLIPGEDGQKQVEMQVEGLPPAVFDLDTGNGSEFVLFRGYAEENGILENRPMISERSGGGVGGRTVSKITTLRSVTFAGYQLGEVPVTVAQEAKGAFHTRRFAGNVGAGVFCRFRMIFDYPHDRLIVEPGPGWDTEPFRRNRTGLQLQQSEGGLEIYFVAPGSPGEGEGLAAGDRIVAVDGKAIGEDFWDTGYRWMFGEEGREVALELGDGRRVDLVLRTYY